MSYPDDIRLYTFFSLTSYVLSLPLHRLSSKGGVFRKGFMIMIMGVRVAREQEFYPIRDTDDDFPWSLDLEFEKPRINKDIFFLVVATDKC